jgi:hypothetical protein
VKVDNNTFPHDKHEVKTFATTPTVWCYSIQKNIDYIHIHSQIMGGQLFAVVLHKEVGLL